MKLRSAVPFVLASLAAAAPVKREIVERGIQNPWTQTKIFGPGNCTAESGFVLGQVFPANPANPGADLDTVIDEFRKGPIIRTSASCETSPFDSLFNSTTPPKLITYTYSPNMPGPYNLPFTELQGTKLEDNAGGCAEVVRIRNGNNPYEDRSYSCSNLPTNSPPIPTITETGHGTTDSPHSTDGPPIPTEHHRRAAVQTPAPTKNGFKRQPLADRTDKTANSELFSKTTLTPSRTVLAKSQNQPIATSHLDWVV